MAFVHEHTNAQGARWLQSVSVLELIIISLNGIFPADVYLEHPVPWSEFIPLAFNFILTSWIISRKILGLYDDNSLSVFLFRVKRALQSRLSLAYRGRGEVNTFLAQWPLQDPQCQLWVFRGLLDWTLTLQCLLAPSGLPHLFSSPHSTKYWKMSFSIFILLRKGLG